MKNIKRYKSIVVIAIGVLAVTLFSVAQAAVFEVNNMGHLSGSSSVTLKGYFSGANGVDVTRTQFEYSTSPSLALAQTTPLVTYQASVTSSNFSATLNYANLQANTTYYFRPVGMNGSNYDDDSISTFTTPASGGSGTGTGSGTCTINSFTINGNSSATIPFGQNATLAWNTTDCSTVTLSGGGLSNAPQNLDGQITIAPSAAGTYTFTLKADGVVTATRILTVTGGGGTGTGTTGNTSCIIYNFKINNSNSAVTLAYTNGMQVLLSWQTNGCTGVVISGGNIPNTVRPANGQLYIAPSAPGTYTLTLTGQGNSTPTATRILTLTGNTTGTTGSGTTGGNTGGIPQNCIINSFATYSTQVNEGSSTNMSWSTSNCTNVSISGIGSVALSGTTSTGALYSTTTFTLFASGVNGTITSTRTITVVPQVHYCDITSFVASSTQIIAGDSLTLSWNSSDCTSVSIQGGNLSGSYPANNSITVAPNTTTSYVITGHGSGGFTDVATVTVHVNQQVQQPPQQQYYCQINYFTAGQNFVPYGSSTTITWNTQNCMTVFVSGPNVSSTGSNGIVNTGALYGTTTYTITAYGTGGTQTQNISVSTGQQSPVPQIPTQNQSCTITNLYASPASVLQGNSTTLYWNTSGNCSYLTITNTSGYTSTVSANGSTTSGTMNTSGTRTFTLSAYGTNGIVSTQTLNVQVYATNTTTAQTTYACNDGYDNDGDGRIDANDPGCSSSTDNSEFNSTATVVNTTNTTATNTTDSSGVNGITISTSTAREYDSYNNRSNLTGLALFSGVTLPGTFVGWLILLIILTLIILLLRNIIGYAPIRGNENNHHRPTGTDGHH